MRSSLFRLPAPVFLLVCIAWFAWSILSLVCRIIIWALMCGIRACEVSSSKFPIRTASKSETQKVCIARTTEAPPKPAVRLVDRIIDSEEIEDEPPVRQNDPDREAKIVRLMGALNIKNRDVAERVIDKGYPVGW